MRNLLTSLALGTALLASTAAHAGVVGPVTSSDFAATSTVTAAAAEPQNSGSFSVTASWSSAAQTGYNLASLEIPAAASNGLGGNLQANGTSGYVGPIYETASSPVTAQTHLASFDVASSR